MSDELIQGVSTLQVDTPDVKYIGAWDQLPDEALIKIFLNLPLGDRFAAQLTCRRWSKAFRFIDNFENAVFKVYGKHSITPDLPGDSFRYALYSALSNTILPKCIKFCLCDIEYEPCKSFWNRHGSKFRSMTIENCKFSLKTILCIFNKCPNLDEISFVKCVFDDVSEITPQHMHNIAKVFGPPRKLSKLEFLACENVHDSFFHCLMQRYMGVESFNIKDTWISLLGNMDRWRVPISVGIANCSLSSFALRNFSTLTDLTLDLHFIDVTTFEAVMSSKDLKLRRVGLVSCYGVEDQNGIAEFDIVLRRLYILQGKTVEELSLVVKIRRLYDVYADIFTSRIAKFRALKSLSLDFDLSTPSIVHFWNLVKNMSHKINATLRIISQIEHTVVANPEVQDPELLPAILRRYSAMELVHITLPQLKSLTVEALPMWIPESFLISLRCLSSLSLSDLPWMTDDYLLVLFENMTQLTEFSLTNCLQITDYGFTGLSSLGMEEYSSDPPSNGAATSLCNLRRLKRLNLDLGQFTSDYTLRIAIRFNLLLSLTLNCSAEFVTQGGFKAIARHNPSLEYLDISFTGVGLVAVQEFILKCPRLKTVRCNSSITDIPVLKCFHDHAKALKVLDMCPGYLEALDDPKYADYLKKLRQRHVAIIASKRD